VLTSFRSTFGTTSPSHLNTKVDSSPQEAEVSPSTPAHPGSTAASSMEQLLAVRTVVWDGVAS
jgi:hypothetical protein